MLQGSDSKGSTTPIHSPTSSHILHCAPEQVQPAVATSTRGSRDYLLQQKAPQPHPGSRALCKCAERAHQLASPAGENVKQLQQVTRAEGGSPAPSSLRYLGVSVERVGALAGPLTRRGAPQRRLKHLGDGVKIRLSLGPSPAVVQSEQQEGEKGAKAQSAPPHHRHLDAEPTPVVYFCLPPVSLFLFPVPMTE